MSMATTTKSTSCSYCGLEPHSAYMRFVGWRRATAKTSTTLICRACAPKLLAWVVTPPPLPREAP